MFDPEGVEVFRITSCCFDETTGTAVFGYALDDDLFFSETYVFPSATEPMEPNRRAALDRALLLLAVTAGVSYYKAAAPKIISVEIGGLTSHEQHFFEALYTDGLGEFYFKNQINPTDRIEWRTSYATGVNADNLDLTNRALIAVGGGKDSCVTIEAVRSLETDILLASINDARPIRDCMDAADLSSINVKRSISKTLVELNDQGALNGHVPVTAIASMALVILAIIKDCNAVVLSNERSASVGNLQWQDREINHQWAKSLAAEQLMADIVKRSVAADLDYFSMLRPFSELDVSRQFATTSRYDDSFTSCNKAFRIDESKRLERWCCDCPKCRFVFLALATAMSPQRLQSIFGKDLLEDETQFGGFEALCGWNATKPFECVGEVEESIAAFQLLGASDHWRDHLVVRHMNNVVFPQMSIPPDLFDQVLTPSSKHCIPARFQDALINGSADVLLRNSEGVS